jgi:hypothetical protein
MVGAEFGPSEPGVTWGRHRTTAGIEFVPLESRSLGVDNPGSVSEFRLGQGAANSGPRFGPIVISEVMYSPADGWPEYVELYNMSPDQVALHAESDSSLAWRFGSGIHFELDPATVMGPGEYMVVAGTDPETFRQLYQPPPNTVVVGPFAGRLDNAGERLELVRPAEPDGGSGVWWKVDWLEYDSGLHWPGLAAGYGPSLERLPPDRYGNEPRNWSALHQGGSPGWAGSDPHRVFLPGLLSR